jgi:hypothetical protein
VDSPLRNFASRLLADAHDLFQESAVAYESASGIPAFWMMCDLKSSASFRLAAGEKAAFMRALGFVQLCRSLAGRHANIQVFKELGDAVLVRATDPRELLEFLVLMDLVGAYARVDEARDAAWPSLEIRSAITFGRAFNIGGDYLGQPLDRLARISGFKDASDNCIAVLDAAARREFDELLLEYPFVTLGPSFLVAQKLLKEGEPTFRLSEMRVDRAEAAKSTHYFAAARGQIEVPSSGLVADDFRENPD